MLGLRTMCFRPRDLAGWDELCDAIRALGGSIGEVWPDFFDVLVPPAHETSARARLHRFVESHYPTQRRAS